MAHQRRSRSGGWSCGGGGGRRHEMGTMNGPDSTLWRERGGWEMTNSQSGMENSWLGLRCRCSHHHHSDNSRRKHATRHSHQHPPASGGRRQSGWAATVKKELCDSYDSPSLCLSTCFRPPPPSLSLVLFPFLRPRLSAPAPSLCPRWLPNEKKLMPEFILELRLLPAPLGCSAQLWGGRGFVL